MFEDLRNTGDDHWSASSGIAPSSVTPIPVDDEDELEHDDDSEILFLPLDDDEDELEHDDDPHKSCGVVPSTNEHFAATLLFTNRPVDAKCALNANHTAS
jgi:hypothetical protein